LIVVAVVGVLLTAGGIGFVMSRVSISDPARITAIAEEICRADIPPTLRPIFGIDLKFMRSAVFVTPENVRPPAVIYLVDTIFESEDILLRQTASIETVAFERLGISNVTQNATLAREVAKIPFEGTNALTHYRRTVRLEEQGKGIVVHQAVFRSQGRTGIATYMLFDVDPAADPGPTFIRSIQPAKPGATP
jgi:hypothetical protein